MLGEGERRHVCASYLIKRDHCLLAAHRQFNLPRFRDGKKGKKRLGRAEPRLNFLFFFDKKIRKKIHFLWINLEQINKSFRG